MRQLFIAPASNLNTKEEILRACQGQTLTICDGNVDRDKGERFLRDEQDIIHFAGHGDLSVLEWSDGPLTENELVSMLAHQKRLICVIITACNSAGVGAAIHNALHVPVVMCQAPIGDEAAVRFSEAFYRALRSGRDLHAAYETGAEVVKRLHPAYANVVTFINGDMASLSSLADLRAELDGVFEHFNRRLDANDRVLAELDTAVNKLTRTPDKTTLIIIVLLAILALEGLPALLAQAAR